jgi:hypothetical protein
MEITRNEYIQRIVNDLQSGSLPEKINDDGPYPNYGKIIILTNVFMWKNGTYHTEQEPSYHAATHEGPLPGGDGGYCW